MSSPATSDESSPRYLGWRVVVACFLMALAVWGFGLYGHSVYLVELTRLHGWQPSVIANASSAGYLFNAVLVLFNHSALIYFGARRFVLFGTLALALALVLLAFAHEPWQIYAAYFTISFSWLAMGLVTIPTLITQSFTHKRGLAISLALNGASFGGIVVAPLLVLLISVTGFKTAMLIAAAVMLIILVPVVIAWVPQHATPAPKAARETAWTQRDALRSLRFWTVAGSFSLVLLAQVAFIVHQIALMEPLTGRAQAALSVSIMTIMAVTGRLTLGAVVDRLDPRLISSVSMFSQAVALLAMTQTREPILLLAACAAYGFSVGNIITLPSLILQREFPAASFGMVLGLATALGTFTGALGPGLIGLIRDATGGYAAALTLCMALKILGGGLVLIRGR